MNLACRNAKELGYPHELWTTRLLARHGRKQGPAEGHSCLAKLAQGTLCRWQVRSGRSERHRSCEFIEFLKLIDAAYLSTAERLRQPFVNENRRSGLRSYRFWYPAQAIA